MKPKKLYEVAVQTFNDASAARKAAIADVIQQRAAAAAAIDAATKEMERAAKAGDKEAYQRAFSAKASAEGDKEYCASRLQILTARPVLDPDKAADLQKKLEEEAARTEEAARKDIMPALEALCMKAMDYDVHIEMLQNIAAAMKANSPEYAVKPHKPTDIAQLFSFIYSAGAYEKAATGSVSFSGKGASDWRDKLEEKRAAMKAMLPK